MTGSSDLPGEQTAPTLIAALPAAERQLLAALVVVGSASLSADELIELADVEDVTPLLANLEQLGLIKHEEKQRYSALGRVGEELRQTDAALSTGDRLLKYMTTLAKDGQLTPERLLDDAEAVLGLTEWAAERQQWKRLLELVKTLQACFEIAHRLEEWLTLVDRGRRAARALGDWQSEVWLLRQLAIASAGVGDPAAAQHYLREADKLQSRRRSILRRGARSDKHTSIDRQAAIVGGGGTARITLWMLGLLAAMVAGGATGYAIGNDNSGVGSTTTQVPVRATVGGKTVTTFTTVTLPATTVLNTTTVTTTTTVYKTTPPATGEAEPRIAPSKTSSG